MRDLRRLLAGCLAAGALASVGGALFDVLHGSTTLTRAIAYGFWIAAAAALVLMLLASSKRLARAVGLPPVIEGPMFLTASVVLTVAGIVVDLLGS
jgi:uncharacterized membrane protein